MRLMTSACVWCVPCEKLRRNTSVPAAIKARSDSSLSHAGPTVAMIFVYLTAGSCGDLAAAIATITSLLAEPRLGYAHTKMTIKTWLEAATLDAERRGLPALKPLLEALARSTAVLRAADWNDDARGETSPHGESDSRPPTPDAR
jgi:hypothetical protein